MPHVVLLLAVFLKRYCLVVKWCSFQAYNITHEYAFAYTCSETIKHLRVLMQQQSWILSKKATSTILYTGSVICIIYFFTLAIIALFLLFNHLFITLFLLWSINGIYFLRNNQREWHCIAQLCWWDVKKTTHSLTHKTLINQDFLLCKLWHMTTVTLC